MLKKKEELEGKKKADGGNGDTFALIEQILKQQQEFNERLAEIEEGKNTRSAAQLKLVELLYDTDDKHLSELTRIPIGIVEPLSISIMLDSLSNPKVRSGEISPVQVLNTAFFKLMRSVGGEHLNKGRDLAGEQASTEAEKGAEYDLGKA